MKKIIALLLTVIFFVACGGEIVETLTTPPPDGGTPPQEGNEQAINNNEFPSLEGWQTNGEAASDGVVDEPEPIILDDITRVSLLIEEFNSASFYIMPSFDDINEIPMENFIALYIRTSDYFDFEFTEEQLNEMNSGLEREGWFGRAGGVFPQTLENFIRENYNNHFNIEGFDFSVINNEYIYYPGQWISIGRSAIWDEKTGALIYLFNWDATGGIGTFCRVLNTYLKDDVYHIISADILVAEYTYVVENYFLHTAEENENGGFNITSKQLIDINEVIFTDEDIERIKDLSAYDLIMVENKPILTYEEIREIAESALDSDNIRISEFHNYSSLGWSLSYDKEEEKNYYIVGIYPKIGEVIINKATGEVTPIEYVGRITN
ncbi:MAG: hypothetical protein FWD48_07165 [Oscillospiraceae bacterium]|nr:hypothetical protein [Oscillospiraceae bacterium]